MEWTTRSCQLHARWSQVNFFVNYCFIRFHSLKSTHCHSAGRQATNSRTLNSFGATFRPESSSDCAAMLDHHIQLSVFIGCEQPWVNSRYYCFSSKIRWRTVINFIRSPIPQRASVQAYSITMNTVPDTVHIESKASKVPEGIGLRLTVTQRCVRI